MLLRRSRARLRSIFAFGDLSSSSINYLGRIRIINCPRDRHHEGCSWMLLVLDSRLVAGTAKYRCSMVYYVETPRTWRIGRYFMGGYGPV
jgi:hypothetical protein